MKTETKPCDFLMIRENEDTGVAFLSNPRNYIISEWKVCA